MKPSRKSWRYARLLGSAVLWLVVGALAVSMVIPYAWMLSTSLKGLADALAFPPRWMPKAPAWMNYAEVWRVIPLGRFFLNSVKVTILSTIGTLLSCSVAGFAFARLRFPGSNLLFAVLLATMMIPGHVTMIPVFIVMSKLGWVNTHYPLWVPSFFGGAFGIFMMRQFFKGIPQSLVDAARIDGCGWLGIYWRIFMPLSGPALATLGLLTFTGAWNDLLGPLIYVNDLDKMTVPVGLTFLQSQHWSNWPLMMTGVAISNIPVLVLFLVSQRYFVKGISTTGLKG